MQAARQRGWGGPRSALPGTTSARARWSTLAYVEKVRPQFLSLRQQTYPQTPGAGLKLPSGSEPSEATTRLS